MQETIWDLKANPWSDAPRFYPPGAHPSTMAMREQLKTAEKLRARVIDLHHTTRPLRFRLPEMVLEPDTRPPPDTTELDRFIVYLRDELAMFEGRESEVKAEYAHMLAR